MSKLCFKNAFIESAVICTVLLAVFYVYANVSHSDFETMLYTSFYEIAMKTAVIVGVVQATAFGSYDLYKLIRMN